MAPTQLTGQQVKNATIDTADLVDNAVTLAKLQDASATQKVLARKTAAAGDYEECTLSELLDFIGSAAQGDILYRGASAWARLAAGTSGNFLKTLGAAANPAWGLPLPAPNNLSGFRLVYVGVADVTVGDIGGTSQCADSANLVQITLTGQATVNLNTDGIGGVDIRTGTGTVSVTSGLSAVVGVSTLFLTEFGTRVGSGTITTSGTAVTGTGTSFMDGPGKLSLGDLIGTSAAYSQVTAIADNTHCTVLASLALTAAVFNVIENPTIQISNNTVEQVTAIATNTALTIGTAASATKTTVAYTIGRRLADGTMPIASQGFMYLWVGTGASGTGCFISTQRTTPFGISGYNTSVRRIGSVLLDAASIISFSQEGDDRRRTYTYENAKIADSTRVLTAGVATAWTAVVMSGVVPPTASSVNLVLTVAASIDKLAFLRRRNTGSSTVSRNTFCICTDTNGSNNIFPNFPCDGAQAIDYGNNNSALNTYIDVLGYNEVL